MFIKKKLILLILIALCINIFSIQSQIIAIDSLAAKGNKDSLNATKTPPYLDAHDLRLNFGWKAGKHLRKIDVVIVHSTFYKNVENPYHILGCLRQFAAYNVSAHYIIMRDGTIFRLVAEGDVAFHAGVSVLPDGTEGGAVNERSIGIELIYTNYETPNIAQINALKLLLDDIRCRLPLRYILGHSDIAPLRRSDPWNFDWSKIGGKKW